MGFLLLVTGKSGQEPELVAGPETAAEYIMPGNAHIVVTRSV